MNLFLIPALLLLTLGLPACQPKGSTVPAVPPAAPAAAARPAAPPLAPGAFDLASIPVTNAAQPPFPYLDLPEALKPDGGDTVRVDAERMLVVAGKELLAVEGRVERRYFSLASAKLSKAAATRNYRAALADMGAVQVNQVQPSDPAVLSRRPARARDRLGVRNLDARYSSYLIRTPTRNIWIVVSIDEHNVNTVAIEEQSSLPPAQDLASAAGRAPG